MSSIGRRFDRESSSVRSCRRAWALHWRAAGLACRRWCFPPHFAAAACAAHLAARHGQVVRPGIVSAGFASSAKDIASGLTAAVDRGRIGIDAGRRAGRRPLHPVEPAGIIAGAGDRLFDAKAEALRLQPEIPGSFVDIIPQAGHMVHHTAPLAVLAMVDRVAAAASMK
ncbi:hypothetical protein NKH41_32670 [Mesorhizobium sp. M1169]|uniref:alpha/beta fold hydrolase n=1 Tax=Mesorhizobium sp. M1169 TaxID=2957066 RepID=UPI003335714C